MCIGLTTSERELGDLTIEPYCSSSQKKVFAPVKSDLDKIKPFGDPFLCFFLDAAKGFSVLGCR